MDNYTFDVIIIGGGPAATSAALTLINRGKTVAVVSNKTETSSLYKAEKVTNYPGLPPMNGAEMSALFRRQLEDSGAVITLKSEYTDEEEIMVTIDDDEEYDRVGAVFMKKLEEMFDYDDEDEDE